MLLLVGLEETAAPGCFAVVAVPEERLLDDSPPLTRFLWRVTVAEVESLMVAREAAGAAMSDVVGTHVDAAARLASELGADDHPTQAQLVLVEALLREREAIILREQQEMLLWWQDLLGSRFPQPVVLTDAFPSAVLSDRVLEALSSVPFRRSISKRV